MLNDNAVLQVGAGNYFKAPQSTPAPGDLTVVSTPWDNLGHTSLEEIFGIASEGGEATILGTLQNKTLRTAYSARSETMTFTLQQFDEDSLRLYFGTNMVPVPSEDGLNPAQFLGVPTEADPYVGAFLAVFLDRSNVFAFYAPKAEIFRNDDMSLSDTESLAGLPLGVKPMQDGTNTWTYAVTPLAAVA